MENKFKYFIDYEQMKTLPNDNFSPESGGNVKPNSAIEAISTQGTIKLKK
jgi:hypothetical protein